MSSMITGTLCAFAGSVTWTLVGHVRYSRKTHGKWWV